MHGVILSNFKRYLDDFIGQEAWSEVVDGAGLEGTTYMPVAMYPDEEMEALLRAAELATGLRRDDLLADFAEWAMGPMIDMYKAMLPVDAGAMVFLLGLQGIHERILRLKDPAASAPPIEVVQCGEDMLEIHYRSQRNMAAMVQGAVKGVASYFDESVSLLGSEFADDGTAHFVFQLQANTMPVEQVV